MLWFLLRMVVLVGIGLGVLLWFGQDHLIYHPRPYLETERQQWRKRGGQELVFHTSQGQQTAFYLSPVEGAAERWWLWVSGNASRALDVAEDLRRWDVEAGWLLVDFPGYGASEGQPSPDAMRETLREAVAALAAQYGKTMSDLVPQLGAAGHSLGAAAAFLAAEELSLSRVVVVAPFTSLTEMARLVVGWPYCLLNRHRYDNRQCLQKLAERGARVWIVHGEADEVVPVTMGRALAEAFPEVICFRAVADVHHNDIFAVAAGDIATAFREAVTP